MKVKQFKNEILLVAFVIAFGQLEFTTAADIRYGAQDCIGKCFSVHSDWFYCSTSKNFGWCCPDNSRSECQENFSEEIYCSQGATSHNYIKYAYCPRKTSVCGTPGPLLRPLLNQNQSFLLVNTMNETEADVCYWEFRVNLTSFQALHPNALLNETFINLVIEERSNLTTYTLQGSSRKTAKNVTVNAQANKTYRYPLSSGQSVYLVAFPSDQTKYTNTTLNLTFNLSTAFYPPEGITVEYQLTFIEDYYDADLISSYWEFIEAGLALGLIILIASIIYICLYNFDRDNAFERRRAKMSKDRRIKDNNDDQFRKLQKIDEQSQEEMDVPSEGSEARSTVRQRKSKVSNNAADGVEEIEMAEMESKEPALRKRNTKKKDQDEN